MFNNIGAKIKGLAKIIAWLGIIASTVYGFYFMIAVHTTIGFGFVLGGSLFSWISSWFMYGFGELIENTATIAANTSRQGSSVSEKVQAAPTGSRESVCMSVDEYIPSRQEGEDILKAAIEDKHIPDGGWMCSRCCTMNESSAPCCKNR